MSPIGNQSRSPLGSALDSFSYSEISWAFIALLTSASLVIVAASPTVASALLKLLTSPIYATATEGEAATSDRSLPANRESLDRTLEILSYQNMKIDMLSDVEIAMIGKARAKKQSEAR